MIAVKEIPTEKLVGYIKAANNKYRSGEPTIADSKYDELIIELKKREPEHEFLVVPEPEPKGALSEETYDHPATMLSTEKAYTPDEIKNWIKRCYKAAASLGLPPSCIIFIGTPKLDGMAGRWYHEDKVLASRGNGFTGQNITSAIKKGVVPEDNFSINYSGELVMKQSYFDANLKDHFAHPRNVVVGAVSADAPNAMTQKALDDGAIEFIGYRSKKIKKWEGNGIELLSGIDTIYKSLIDVDYPTDGVVFEVGDEKVKREMGATSHHHSWMIAKKVRGDLHECKVNGVTWQVSRTGRVTPVINIEPTKISGAVVRNVTGHNVTNIIRNNIGEGAIIEVTRSGEVIPYMTKVIKAALVTVVPTNCPNCDSSLQHVGEFLECHDEECTMQSSGKIVHFFKTVGTVDGFGPSVSEKLVEAGYADILAVLNMGLDDFLKAGFTSGIGSNLAKAVQEIRETPVEEWRLLGAFGVHKLRANSSRKLFDAFSNDIDIPKVLNLPEPELIRVLGMVAGMTIKRELTERKEYLSEVYNLGWTFKKAVQPTEVNEAVVKKTFVFTGTMLTAKRDDLQNRVIELGGNASKSLSKNTDYLVAGEKAGSKLAKAEKLGVTILNEETFLSLIS